MAEADSPSDHLTAWQICYPDILDFPDVSENRSPRSPYAPELSRNDLTAPEPWAGIETIRNISAEAVEVAGKRKSVRTGEAGTGADGEIPVAIRVLARRPEKDRREKQKAPLS